MYAIIETGGKQYKVQVGDLVRVEKLECKVGDKVTFDKVLAVGDSEVTLGNPTISGKTVTGTCTKQEKDKKVILTVKLENARRCLLEVTAYVKQ